MTHFIDTYADRVNDILHEFAGPCFFKQEIVEVPGLLTGLLITYDGVRDDRRKTLDQMSWPVFLDRMSMIKPDWEHFDRKLMEELGKRPEKGLGGWEGRTIYFIKGGSHPEQWTPSRAEQDAIGLLKGSAHLWGQLVQNEAEHLEELIPIGREHFREYEHMVRVIWRFLFRGELGEGQAQSRTEPENEGIEIRDLVFANKADAGFWKDLKDKYSASEIVVDAKNTGDLTRDDLRQLYCYLKPALGFWGFIVCRSRPSQRMQAFNRTLYQNFSQRRGVLILCDDDLRRMAQIVNRGQSASAYLQERMSEFVRSI